MLVRDLIANLSILSPNLEVWVASDEEGNSFAPVAYLDTYLADVVNEDIIDEADADEYEDSELVPVVVFWP